MTRWSQVATMVAVSALRSWIVMANTGESDAPSRLEEVYVGFYFVALVAVAIVVAWVVRRRRNPFTKLPPSIRRRRARGPLNRG